MKLLCRLLGHDWGDIFPHSDECWRCHYVRPHVHLWASGRNDIPTCYCGLEKPELGRFFQL